MIARRQGARRGQGAPLAAVASGACRGAPLLRLLPLALLLPLLLAPAASAQLVAVEPEEASPPPAAVLPPPPPPPPRGAPRPSSSSFEADLVREAVDLGAAHNADQEEDARSMESLLHWAIEHSDPAVLAERAGRKDPAPEEVVKEFLDRKQRVKELYDAVSSQPTEADLMRKAAAALAAPGAAPEQLVEALVELQTLVEPIDNANDLHTVGGLDPVVGLLGPAHPPDVRAAAAHVLGTAASNNLRFIRQLTSRHPGAVEALLAVAQLPGDAHAAKGLYALGAVVRGSREARAAFYAASGLAHLEAAAAPGGRAGERVRAKALHLLTDLLELSAEGPADAPDPAAGEEGAAAQQEQAGSDEVDRLAAGVLPQFAAAALHLLQNAGEDLRAQETALLALRTIVARRPADGREALEALGAEGVLREALVDLEAAIRPGDDEAAAAVAPSDGGGEGEGGGGGEASNDAAYRHYLAGLCADVLQEVSIEGAFDIGHDEL